MAGARRIARPTARNTNIYTDGLKIYNHHRLAHAALCRGGCRGALGVTTCNLASLPRRRAAAYAPFSRSITKEEREAILDRAMKQSEPLPLDEAGRGVSEEKIKQAFQTSGRDAGILLRRYDRHDYVAHGFDSLSEVVPAARVSCRWTLIPGCKGLCGRPRFRTFPIQHGVGGTSANRVDRKTLPLHPGHGRRVSPRATCS